VCKCVCVCVCVCVCLCVCVCVPLARPVRKPKLSYPKVLPTAAKKKEKRNWRADEKMTNVAACLPVGGFAPPFFRCTAKRGHTRTRTHAHTRTHKHTHAHTKTHTYTHTHIHTHTHSQSGSQYLTAHHIAQQNPLSNYDQKNSINKNIIRRQLLGETKTCAHHVHSRPWQAT
jgi:hypothetical protein